MKNTLIIDNFLIIKHVEIDVKRYNVLIGPQASGKSIIAKLLYLFYQLPNNSFKFLSCGKDINDFKKEMIETFQKIFPENVWNNQDFKIEFSTGKDSFFFEHQKTKELSFSCSNDSFIAGAINESKNKTVSTSKDELLKFRLSNGFESSFINCGSSCTFIPAGRSIFATISNNIFMLIHYNQRFDYFFTQFASDYELQKMLYLGDAVFELFGNKEECLEIQRSFLNGVYVRKNDIDYIQITNTSGEPVDVEVSKASSGQQELLPILLMLSDYVESFFMIEEPEAHIFPKAQYDLIKYIVSRRISNTLKQAFLFTTHSPYILTAMNNLVYADILAKKFKKTGNEEALKKLNEIYSERERIPADELSAYYVEGGEAKNIVDTETGLICAEELDRISGMISERFDQMMDLESENEKS